MSLRVRPLRVDLSSSRPDLFVRSAEMDWRYGFAAFSTTGDETAQLRGNTFDNKILRAGTICSTLDIKPSPVLRTLVKKTAPWEKYCQRPPATLYWPTLEPMER